MADYKQMLIDEQAHTYIKDAKRLLGRTDGKQLSSKEVINELIGRRVRYLRLGKEIKGYINEFVSNAASDRNVRGLLLFGSVAKNTFGRYSDIDIMVLVNVEDALGYLNKINKAIKDAEPARENLVGKGLYLRISPLVLSTSEFDNFRSIYINFVEEGIILFERMDSLTDFLNNIKRNVNYEHIQINDVPVIKWKINKSLPTQ